MESYICIEKMKICFINPAPRSYITNRSHETTGAYPPLGILYIMAYIKGEGYDCILIDQHATKIPTTQVLERVKRYDPDVVAFNTLIDVNMGLRATFIAKIIKKWNPNLKIVFGNCHATFNHNRILKKYPFVDVCVRGEGEVTFLEFIKELENGRDLKDVKGITYRNNDKIIINHERALIKNLDDLPFPDREACDDIKYRQNYGGLNAEYGEFTTMQSSRGCTYNCKFCVQSKISHRTWRTRSITNIVSELEYLESEGYTNLYWVDDNFTNNPRRAIKLLHAMRKHKFDFNWICDQRVDLATAPLLKEMRKAGCRSIALGIESANQRIIDYITKGITPKMAVDAAKNARRANIDFIMGTFIIGLPTESLDEIKQTFHFAQRLEIDIPQFHIFGAIPGTDIWDDLVRKGMIDPEKYWENGVKTLRPPLNVVEKEMHRAYFRFYTRPRFILEQIPRTLASKHRLKIIYSNRKTFTHIRNIKTFADFTFNTWTHGDYPE
jgi:anaerobic magnesium-protoporphyrin IX monomethyl ester cyclase